MVDMDWHPIHFFENSNLSFGWLDNAKQREKEDCLRPSIGTNFFFQSSLKS